MKPTPPALNWLVPRIRDLEQSDGGKERVEQIRVSLTDDIPYPVDFKLPPEEYARLYAEKHGEAIEDQTAADPQPDRTEEKWTDGTKPQTWLRGSISTTSQEDPDQPQVVIVEKRPAATFDLDPEEYRKIRDELEREREQITGFYHEPENFWNMGSIWE